MEQNLDFFPFLERWSKELQPFNSHFIIILNILSL